MDSIVYKKNNQNEKDRLDTFLSNKLNVSRSKINKMLQDSAINVNGNIVKSGYILKDLDIINYEFDDNEEILKLESENIPLDILFEDNEYIVINKQRGLVVHPCDTTKNHTLVNALLYHTKDLPTVFGEDRPGIVHRIDKDTTGLLVVAKTHHAHEILTEEIKTKTMKRYYIGLVDGNIKNDSGIINKAIGRDLKNRKRMSVNNPVRDALTIYKVLERFGEYTLVEFELQTGRTHQIRAHVKSINHPLVGDKLYNGSNKFKVGGQLLHAYKLEFISPTNNNHVEYKVDLPEDFQKVLKKLRKN